MIEIAPSILSADFSRLGEDIKDVEKAGAHWLHVDVMDGHFVPNISLGLPVVASVRKVTDLFLDVHLMISEPLRYAVSFCAVGADAVVFHLESDTPEHIADAIRTVKAAGKKVGLAIKPATPAEQVFPWLAELDIITVMTVEPGFGGQKFRSEMLPKIVQLREQIEKRSLSCLIEVDGGINAETAAVVKAAGANVLVAGNAVFGAADRAEAIRSIIK